MKKRTFVVLSVIFLLSALLCGCEIGKEYTVSFDANFVGAAEIPSQTVASGKKCEEPTQPSRDGYVFLGWFRDNGLSQQWDFTQEKVTQDCTIYAGWDRTTGDAFAENIQDKDFRAMKTPGSQEAAYLYSRRLRGCVLY